MSTIESSKIQADETTAKSIETAYQVLLAEQAVTVTVATESDGKTKTYTLKPTTTDLGKLLGEKLQGGLNNPQQSSTPKWCLDPATGTVTARAAKATGEVELN